MLQYFIVTHNETALDKPKDVGHFEKVCSMLLPASKVSGVHSKLKFEFKNNNSYMSISTNSLQ